MSVIGSLANAASGELPEVQGPKACTLMDITRHHELSAKATLELLKPNGRFGTEFSKVVDVVTTFDAPVTYTMDLLQIEDMIESEPEEYWKRALGQRLRSDKNTRILFEVIRARMSFLFRDKGAVGVGVRASGGRLTQFGLGGSWRWRNEAALESVEELCVGVKYAFYDYKREIFVTNNR